MAGKPRPLQVPNPSQCMRNSIRVHSRVDAARGVRPAAVAAWAARTQAMTVTIHAERSDISYSLVDAAHGARAVAGKGSLCQISVSGVPLLDHGGSLPLLCARRAQHDVPEIVRLSALCRLLTESSMCEFNQRPV